MSKARRGNGVSLEGFVLGMLQLILLSALGLRGRFVPSDIRVTLKKQCRHLTNAAPDPPSPQPNHHALSSACDFASG